MPTLRKFLEKINIAGAMALDEPMAAHCSFRIGGPADAWIRPASPGELARLVSEARREGIPLFALGGGANILVGDGGIRGIAVDSGGLDGIREEEGRGGTRLLVAGAGVTMDGLCEAALARGLAGLETFYGMPGSVGGSCFMNARCYEVEVADRLAWVSHLDAEGAARRRETEAAEWSYKRSPFQPGGPAAGAFVLEAAFVLRPGDREAIQAVMAEKRADREAKGHYRLPSAGSVFKNDRRLGRPTGKILDELGFRGRRIGGAMVSAWHANIFVNAGGATARDMLDLVELARRETLERLGIGIEPEILTVGEFTERP